MSPCGKHFLGIDFSGNVQSWRPGRARNVWIAQVTEDTAQPSLQSLLPVQRLEGESHPFQRMLTRLARRDFAAAAIDAPFSIPAACLPTTLGDRRRELLREIAALPLEAGRPFPSGQQLVDAVSARCTWEGKKPRRLTEREWSVNVRSTLWAGPRGGAPFTAACLFLIAQSGLSCWPWVESGEALLVEAFPAAQLRTWKLPCQKYGGSTPEQVANRDKIVDNVVVRMNCNDDDIHQMRQNPDALDAVLCCFAAIAIAEGRLARPRGDGDNGEGWIAVHD